MEENVALGALALAAMPWTRVVGVTLFEVLGEWGIFPLAITLDVLKVGCFDTCWGRGTAVPKEVVLELVALALVSHKPESGSSVAETDFFRSGVGATVATGSEVTAIPEPVLVLAVIVIEPMVPSSAVADDGVVTGEGVTSNSTSSSRQNCSISAKSISLKLAPLVSSLLPKVVWVAKGLMSSPSSSESMANSLKALLFEFILRMSSSDGI